MLRFEDPIFLWLLCILPVLILIRLIGWRRRHAKLKKLGDPELLKQFIIAAFLILLMEILLRITWLRKIP